MVSGAALPQSFAAQAPGCRKPYAGTNRPSRRQRKRPRDNPIPPKPPDQTRRRRCGARNRRGACNPLTNDNFKIERVEDQSGQCPLFPRSRHATRLPVLSRDTRLPRSLTSWAANPLSLALCSVRVAAFQRNVRPVSVASVVSITAHVFLCAFARFPEWHLRRRQAPTPFADDYPERARARHRCRRPNDPGGQSGRPH